jgi:hypothetical protein
MISSVNHSSRQIFDFAEATRSVGASSYAGEYALKCRMPANEFVF